MISKSLTVLNHPLVEHKLTLMREKATETAKFRALLREISLLLAYEVLSDLKLHGVEIETPMERMTANKLEGKKLCFISMIISKLFYGVIWIGYLCCSI